GRQLREDLIDPRGTRAVSLVPADGCAAPPSGTGSTSTSGSRTTRPKRGSPRPSTPAAAWSAKTTPPSGGPWPTPKATRSTWPPSRAATDAILQRAVLVRIEPAATAGRTRSPRVPASRAPRGNGGGRSGPCVLSLRAARQTGSCFADRSALRQVCPPLRTDPATLERASRGCEGSRHAARRRDALGTTYVDAWPSAPRILRRQMPEAPTLPRDVLPPPSAAPVALRPAPPPAPGGAPTSLRIGSSPRRAPPSGRPGSPISLRRRCSASC